ncbi:MAG: hypothetical protein C4530_17335 [Desulfobacteraceae bacterium]|nr:MAG: hypothetical protein C4530_17335 [Desulfobacteraceae bacterium]
MSEQGTGHRKSRFPRSGALPNASYEQNGCMQPQSAARNTRGEKFRRSALKRFSESCHHLRFRQPEASDALRTEWGEKHAE